MQRDRSSDASVSFLSTLASAAAEARPFLLGKGVAETLCHFTSEPAPEPNKINVPPQALTKFQAEQALGDWAEEQIGLAINRQSNAWKAIPFGDSDKTLAQEEGFAEAYRTGKRRELAFGKRADLLLFPAEADVPSDFNSLTGEEAEACSRNCVTAIEVRSSRTTVDRFVSYRKQQVEAGKRPTRLEPSITVKTEDLAKVYRWMARNGKPLVYVQVFFDRVYGLNFVDAFKYVADQGAKLKLEGPKRSGKETIFVPVSRAELIGRVEEPTFELVHLALDDGRHEIFGRPVTGSIELSLDGLASLIGRY